MELSTSQIHEYCEILGVRAGTSADEVKQAFRKCIKSSHPDANESVDESKAQKLIEAYQALKKGVPYYEKEESWSTHWDRHFVGGDEHEKHYSSYWKDFTVLRGKMVNTQTRAKRSGTKIFEEGFKSKNPFFNLDSILSEAEDVPPEFMQDLEEDWDNAPSYSKVTETRGGKKEEQYFNRAEKTLREVVQYF